MPTLSSPSAPLGRLRSDLARLRRRRSLVRRGTAIATAILILLGALTVAFAVDYLIDLSPIQRAIAFLGIAVAVGWFARSRVGSGWGASESDAEIALEVGRRHGLAGDLLAAMQFQSDEARSWGSPQLEQAVVSDVDDASRDLNVFDGFRWTPLPTRLLLVSIGLAAIIALTSLFPRYAMTFGQRLMLADISYPTRTVISSLTINGKAIDLTQRSSLQVPAGASIVFVATAEGSLPSDGTIAIQGDAGGATEIPLKRQAGSANSEKSSSFVGTLQSLTEPVMFRVLLGDAKAPSRRIELIPRPSVTIDLLPNPPAYAASNAPDPPPPGVRTAFVLAVSSVGLTVHASNKPLRNVTVSVRNEQPNHERRDSSDAPAQSSTNDATAVASLMPSADRKTWTLDPVGTPFANVEAPFTFEVKAVDDDGLSPAEPILGSLRIRSDRPPRVTAAAVVRRVLPSGKPTVTYSAADDFGVKAMRAKLAIVRSDGTDAEDAALPLPTSRVSATEVQGRHSLDLSSLSLSKGDRVTVSVEAEDVRGDRPGETATAEPLIFEVTDREGLLATLLEADERSADQLDAIIRRELGIGGER